MKRSNTLNFNTSKFLQTVKEAFNQLADNMGTGLKCGDPPREVSDARLGSVKVQVSTLEDEIVSSSLSGSPTFDPGPSLSGQYSAPRQCGGGRICCGVFLKLIQYKEEVIVADKRKQRNDIQVVSSQVRFIKKPTRKLRSMLCHGLAFLDFWAGFNKTGNKIARNGSTKFAVRMIW